MMRNRAIPGVAALVAAALACAPASATGSAKPRIKADDTPRLVDADLGRFQFTAPGRPRALSVEKSFRFTPSGAAGRRAVALGVTARGPAPASGGQAARAAAPTEVAATYGVDLNVAWRGFALQGGLNRADGEVGLLPRENAEVGLSYGGRRWRTGVLASAERSGALGALTPEERYGFEAKGAFVLSPKLSVNAGARYRMRPEGAGPLTVNGEDRAVFVGGALAF